VLESGIIEINKTHWYKGEQSDGEDDNLKMLTVDKL
jgi:hypothetical protein